MNFIFVNIIWEVFVNDFFVIGFMVNIIDGDNWFILNILDISLVVFRLEIGKNYVIIVVVFN